MIPTNYLGGKRRLANQWEGYSFYQLYRDGEGNFFKGGFSKWVIFDGDALVGEFSSLNAGNEAFLDGVRAENGIRRKDYKGVPQNS